MHRFHNVTEQSKSLRTVAPEATGQSAAEFGQSDAGDDEAPEPRMLAGAAAKIRLRSLAGNVSWLVADRVVRMVSGLFVGILVARYLGPAQYGMLNYAMALSLLFSSLSTLGLDNVFVRDLVSDSNEALKVLRSAFVVKFCGATLGAIGAVLTCHILGQATLAQWLVLAISIGTLFQSYDVIDLWFQSKVASKFTVYARGVSYLVISLARVVLVITHAPLLWFAIAGAGETALGALGLFVAWRTQGNRFDGWRPDYGYLARLFKTCWPLMLSGIAVMIYFRIGLVMLGQMSGPAAVGIYSAATRISELWYFVPTAIASSVFPWIIEGKKAGEGTYYRRLQSVFTVMAIIALSIAVPVSIFSRHFVVLLFGKTYEAAGPILAVHIWAGVCVGSGVIRELWVVTENYQKLSLCATLAGAGANIIANLALIPIYGPLGAAVSVVIAQFVAVYAVTAVPRRSRRIFALQIAGFLPWRLLRRNGRTIFAKT